MTQYFSWLEHTCWQVGPYEKFCMPVSSMILHACADVIVTLVGLTSLVQPPLLLLEHPAAPAAVAARRTANRTSCVVSLI